MKKYTNRILIIAGIIVLIGSFILISFTLKKAPQDSCVNSTISYSTDNEESTYTDEFTTTMDEENN